MPNVLFMPFFLSVACEKMNKHHINLAWTVTSYSVDGSDATSTTYSMNQQLYVMIPDETTVQEAKNKLADLDNTVAQDSEATAEPEATAAPEEPAA